jgi:signal peptidase I
MTATVLKMEPAATDTATGTTDTAPAGASYNWLRHSSTSLLIVVVILVVVGGGGVAAGVWRFATIDTGSMRPILEPGDVAIMRPEPLSQLRVGQIVAFHPPGEPTVTVIHRVVTIDRHGRGAVIQTKGDANDAID